MTPDPALLAWVCRVTGLAPTDDRLPRILAALPQTAQALSDVLGSAQGFGTVTLAVERGMVTDVTGETKGRYRPPRGA